MACKTIRHDVLKLYYGRNVFEASCCPKQLMNVFVDWLERLGAGYRTTLKDLLLCEPASTYEWMVFIDMKKKLAGMGAQFAVMKVQGGGSYHRVSFASLE